MAADLVLLDQGKSDYQIVVPDQLPNEQLTKSLQQTARLVQTAFAANGATVAIVRESERDTSRPAILLGDTKLAREQSIEPARLKDWSYVQRAIGKDVLIVGHDHPAKAEAENLRRPSWDRVGTTKGVVDFLHRYAGVRFLYPDVAPYSPVSAAEKMDLANSPAMEFLPAKTITVPADLNQQKTPMLRVNTSHPAGGGFYDLAMQRFPRVDELFGGHTWQRAVPPEKYYETHPEYFALLSGSREKPLGGNAQYCLSNPDVQELIYRDLASQFDRGYLSVDIGQPDGFRECQCEECNKLFGTGKDWSEKIWLFNRLVAERLQKSHPGRQVSMMSYILTAAPPKSFQEFPANTCVMLTGTNEEDIAPWRGHVVPRGYTGYVYNWCPNMASRYTPMRTPSYIEAQVKRLAANHIQSVYRDGPGQLFGLEGPVYYTMGRMFDDPEHNTAGALVTEFCEAAFGKSAPSMLAFYDQLFHAINLYSDHIGTRCDAWTYQPSEGRRRKSVMDPFQLLGFMYTPSMLAALDAELSQAEQLAPTAKVRTRLKLVRTEFEYVRNLTRVVHLNHAYQIHPDVDSRNRLLDAIDARNAAIEVLFDTEHRTARDGWTHILFPFNGHDAKHLRLYYDGYQEPFANTCLNWDTKSMRNAPTPTKKRLAVAAARGPVTLDSSQWPATNAHELTHQLPLNKLPRATTLRFLYDDKNLYVRAECELEPEGPYTFTGQRRDTLLTHTEALDLYLAPFAGQDVAFRLMTGANAAAKYDAVAGRIADVMDPRHGKDDPTWNGEWTSETRLDEAAKRWHALVVVPFESLGVKRPTQGAVWKGNFARYHMLPRNKFDRATWSSSVSSGNMNDRSLFGEIVFE